MSVGERVAKLGALLLRVAERARAPRAANGVSAHGVDDVAPSSLDGVDGVDELLAAPASDREVREVLVGGAESRAAATNVDEPFSPPAVDVEIVSEVVVDDIAVEDDVSDAADVALREELPSRERIVAASPSIPPDQALALDAPLEDDLPTAETGERLVASTGAEAVLDADTEVPPDVIVTAVEEDEDQLEPPASSRRPIVLEPKLEELAFGDAVQSEEPHAPPPESGRQVAAPMVADDFDALTGVRHKDAEPASSPMSKKSERPATAAARVQDAQTPEVTTGARLATQAAIFEGEARVFKPQSFGELLDATLSL